MLLYSSPETEKQYEPWAKTDEMESEQRRIKPTLQQFLLCPKTVQEL
jgi:hypothetical protein